MLSGGNALLPGSYRVDVLVNDSRRTPRCDVRARPRQRQGDALRGRRLAASRRRAIAEPDPPLEQDDPACLDLAALMPQAAVDYDSTRLQLKLSIPQAF